MRATRDGGTEGRRVAGRPAQPSVAPSRRPYPLALPLLALLALARLPEALLLLRLDEVGVAVALVPLAWAGLHLVRTAAAWQGGRLTDRLGGPRVVLLAGLLFAVLLLLMARAETPAAAVAAFLALGVATALSEPAERALVAGLGGGSGRAFGGYHALTGFAALPAALAFGALWQRSGAGPALAASAAAVAAGAVAVGAGLGRTGPGPGKG